MSAVLLGFLIGGVIGFCSALIDRVRLPVERAGAYALIPLVFIFLAVWQATKGRRRAAPPAPPASRPVEVAAGAVEVEIEIAKGEAAAAVQAPQSMDAGEVAAGLARYAKGAP